MSQVILSRNPHAAQLRHFFLERLARALYMESVARLGAALTQFVQQPRPVPLVVGLYAVSKLIENSCVFNARNLPRFPK
jgi:hypothetical protein